MIDETIKYAESLLIGEKKYEIKVEIPFHAN